MIVILFIFASLYPYLYDTTKPKKFSRRLNNANIRGIYIKNGNKYVIR
jgi:hypothetical protein